MIDQPASYSQPLNIFHMSPIASVIHNHDHSCMSRLDYMQEYELAIETILDELPVLEDHVAAGGHFDPSDIHKLTKSLGRLAAVIQMAEQAHKSGWDVDKEPLPAWLKRQLLDDKEDDSQSDLRRVR
jgi:hypothetical protein